MLIPGVGLNQAHYADRTSPSSSNLTQLAECGRMRMRQCDCGIWLKQPFQMVRCGQSCDVGGGDQGLQVLTSTAFVIGKIEVSARTQGHVREEFCYRGLNLGGKAPGSAGERRSGAGSRTRALTGAPYNT